LAEVGAEGGQRGCSVGLYRLDVGGLGGLPLGVLEHQPDVAGAGPAPVVADGAAAIGAPSTAAAGQATTGPSTTTPIRVASAPRPVGSSASPVTERSTWPRDAPNARRRADSRVRWATRIEKVL